MLLYATMILYDNHSLMVTNYSSYNGLEASSLQFSITSNIQRIRVVCTLLSDCRAINW